MRYSNGRLRQCTSRVNGKRMAVIIHMNMWNWKMAGTSFMRLTSGESMSTERNHGEMLSR